MQRIFRNLRLALLMLAGLGIVGLALLSAPSSEAFQEMTTGAWLTTNRSANQQTICDTQFGGDPCAEFCLISPNGQSIPTGFLCCMDPSLLADGKESDCENPVNQ